MQGTKNQVSCQRCLHSDLGRLDVADFANQNDVGSLPQHGANDAREVQADLVLYLYLIHTRQVVLNWLLSSNDLPIRTVQLVQCGIQRRRLARTRRPSHQKDTVRPLDDRLEALVIVLGKTQIFNANLYTAAVQDTHHGRLTVYRWQNAHAQIEVLARNTHLDTPVLRASFLRNVDGRHDLDAG